MLTFLVHLTQKFIWTIAITLHQSSVCPLCNHPLLWNYKANWNQTLQEWCLIGPLPISSFRHDLAKTMGTHDNSWFWLTGTFFKSSSQKLQVQMICNREQMMFARSSTKIPHFNLFQKKHRCQRQLLFLIGWNFKKVLIWNYKIKWCVSC